ncbi:hypothetical protein VTK73DRAFT_3110 [Phialemonium thermophilum]|uniref:Uncharacterized protein n=1 Tax=Phialemonium thermophilum TaxID=223376 RepID=A0ABR3VKS4_9PEZI
MRTWLRAWPGLVAEGLHDAPHRSDRGFVGRDCYDRIGHRPESELVAYGRHRRQCGRQIGPKSSGHGTRPFSPSCSRVSDPVPFSHFTQECRRPWGGRMGEKGEGTGRDCDSKNGSTLGQTGRLLVQNARRRKSVEDYFYGSQWKRTNGCEYLVPVRMGGLGMRLYPDADWITCYMVIICRPFL